MRTVGILQGVFAKTSSVCVSLGCVCRFLFVCIQEMFCKRESSHKQGQLL